MRAHTETAETKQRQIKKHGGKRMMTMKVTTKTVRNDAHLKKKKRKISKKQKIKYLHLVY